MKLSNRRYQIKVPVSAGLSRSQKGIYHDTVTGQDVFIKTDIDHQFQKQAFLNHQFFYHQNSSSEVIIPKPLSLNQNSLVIEYFPNAKSLTQAKSTTCVNTYLKVLEFLANIHARSSLPRKTAAYQLLTLPYFFLKNLIAYPAYTHLFLRSFLAILPYSLKWIKLPADCVSHGDINVANILLDNSKVILLDFSHACVSHQYFNFCQSLNSAWFQKGFHQKLWNKIVAVFKLEPNDQDVLKSFVIYNLMQRLSQRYANSRQKNFYLNRLKGLLNLPTVSTLLDEHGYKDTNSIEQDNFGRFHGIVSDKRGRKFFVKAATGKSTYGYRSLFAEAHVSRLLSRLVQKVRVESNGFRLQVPPVKKIIAQNQTLCLVSRYTKGRKLLAQPSSLQAKMLPITINLVAKLSAKTHRQSLGPYLRDYSRFGLLLFSPIRLLKAVWSSPSVIIGLISAARQVLSLTHADSPKYGLIHADINASNILMKGKTIYLTDWEEAGWGMSSYNMIGPLCVHWETKEIRDSLIEYLRTSGQISELSPLLAYRALILFSQALPIQDERRIRDAQLLKFVKYNKII